MLRLLALFFLSLFLSSSAHAAGEDAINKQFRTWIESSLWPQAQGEGVSRGTFDSALANVSVNLELPDLVLPGPKPKPPKNQHQAEFSSPANYFSEKTISGLVSGGKARAGQFKNVLGRIEKKYRVPRQILLAIWGRESGFGTVKIPHDAFDVLATKAFMSSRKDFFQVELLAALQILERGYMDRAGMKTSWAGALGQPQFMPSSYLRYAQDFDGDGRRDIWASPPDVFAFLNQGSHFEASEKLAVLMLDQQQRWKTSHPLKVEDYLDNISDLASDPQNKLQLAVGEFQARQNSGTLPSIDEFVTRIAENHSV